MQTPENDAIPAAPWAIGISLALLVVTGGAAIFTAWDHWHLGELEQVSTPTAVGDTHYGKMPAGKTGPIGLKYQGQPLVIFSEGKMHDARLLREATDDSGYYWLYQPDPATKEGNPSHFYLKLAPNDYMEVGTR